MMRRISASIFWAVASDTFWVRAHGMAEEDFFLVLAECDRAEFVGQAEARHHGAGHAGGLFDVGNARRS